MTTDPAWRGRATGLTDRLSERHALDRLVDAVRAGESRVLVMHGEPGVGKTVLLDYLAGRASEAACLVTRSTGCSRRWSSRSRGCISCVRRC